MLSVLIYTCILSLPSNITFFDLSPDNLDLERLEGEKQELERRANCQGHERILVACYFSKNLSILVKRTGKAKHMESLTERDDMPGNTAAVACNFILQFQLCDACYCL
jgi:hypothetical protein